MINELIYGNPLIHESFGQHGEFGTKVQLCAPVEITEGDSYEISGLQEQIMNVLRRRAIQSDPNEKERAVKNRTSLVACFGDALIFVEEIPNGYCSRYCCEHLPWFVVTTKIGRVKIGWRKRVIAIDWNDTTEKRGAEELFPKEDVTRAGSEIHAWGYDKAKEYLNRLLGGC